MTKNEETKQCIVDASTRIADLLEEGKCVEITKSKTGIRITSKKKWRESTRFSNEKRGC